MHVTCLFCLFLCAQRVSSRRKPAVINGCFSSIEEDTSLSRTPFFLTLHIIFVINKHFTMIKTKETDLAQLLVHVHTNSCSRDLNPQLLSPWLKGCLCTCGGRGSTGLCLPSGQMHTEKQTPLSKPSFANSKKRGTRHDSYALFTAFCSLLTKT